MVHKHKSMARTLRGRRALSRHSYRRLTRRSSNSHPFQQVPDARWFNIKIQKEIERTIPSHIREVEQSTSYSLEASCNLSLQQLCSRALLLDWSGNHYESSRLTLNKISTVRGELELILHTWMPSRRYKCHVQI